MVFPYLKPHILFNSNGLAIWHGFPVITHIIVKSGHRFEFDQLKFFMRYSYVQVHILQVYQILGLHVWKKNGRKSAI